MKQAITMFAMLTGLYDDIKAEGRRGAGSRARGPRAGARAARVSFTMPGTAGR